MKACLAPVFFNETNDRERQEYSKQIESIQALYGDSMRLLPAVSVGEPIDACADAILFPQMIFAAFRHDDELMAYRNYPMLVITSRFGTVEMWDWEIITYLRDLGLKVFSPYSIELGKTIMRALAVRRGLNGAKFLMFQDTPGEGMQANIFKKFYWWEQQSTDAIEEIFGCKIIFKSWKTLCGQARQISDEAASAALDKFIPHSEGVRTECLLKAAKIYIAVKRAIDEIGGVEAVGSNCLNESFHCDSTPCLAWNMLFELDDILWACEGDTLSMLSTYILYRSIGSPVMMTNLYPFLVGMAALAHEKIERFPDIQDSDNCALGVHCGYFGFVPRSFCTEWTLKPKVLEIVNDDAVAVDARMPIGKVTLAKLYPGFKQLSVIRAEIVDYVQYPGSDCRNGALIRYNDGHAVMDALCSHHSLIISGDVKPQLMKVAQVFGWEVKCL